MEDLGKGNETESNLPDGAQLLRKKKPPLYSSAILMHHSVGAVVHGILVGIAFLGPYLIFKLLTYLLFLSPDAVHTSASYPCLTTALASSRIQVLGCKRVLLQSLSRATESQQLP